MYNLLRPILFSADAETVHYWTVELCRVAGGIPGFARLTQTLLEFDAPILRTNVAGLSFSNPIGLAAGWDKSARALPLIDSLGLGFAEIGSVSARKSVGNSKPRLFRLPEDQAIIVNYGLPNDGAEMVAQRLSNYQRKHPLGVNIVKTNDPTLASSTEEIIADYCRSAALLNRCADYLMLNLSCPNAEGGKEFFSTPGSIERLLQQLKPLDLQCPVFAKVAPTDDAASIDRLLAECDAFEFVKGFCFNLPTGKPPSLELSTSRDSLSNKPGSIAGRPVSALIDRCLSNLYQRMDQSRYAIIGAGGVFTAEDAYEKIRLGASLVQIYTGLVYEGPGIAKRICRGLAKRLRRDGFQNVSDAVGSHWRS